MHVSMVVCLNVPCDWLRLMLTLDLYEKKCHKKWIDVLERVSLKFGLCLRVPVVMSVHVCRGQKFGGHSTRAESFTLIGNTFDVQCGVQFLADG